MVVIGTDVVERYFATHAGHKGMTAVRKQYEVWRTIAEAALWTQPAEAKRSHPKASILKGGRVVFNIKGNDFRLVCTVDYRTGIVLIRFFGSHAEYSRLDAESV